MSSQYYWAAMPLTFDEQNIGSMRNIDALLESERQFRTLADNMSQLAWTADPAGTIYWYNERWYEYTGASLEAMRALGWRSVHHPEHVGRVTARLLKKPCATHKKWMP